MHRRALTRAVWLSSLAAACTDIGTAAVAVDPTVRFQTIIGWEATAELGDTDLSQDSVARYRDAMIEYAVDSVGLNALRLEVRSGDEHPEDRTAEFLEDVEKVRWWKEIRYSPVNDNDDPFSIDPDGFAFTWLDHRMRTLVIPMKQRLEARGESLYVTLTFVDFDESEFKQLADPEEYAEYVLAVFSHMQSTYGFVPDALEVLLEPDVPGWDARTVGSALVAAGDRLAANGFTPAFVAPSNASMAGALEYFQAMVEQPRTLEYLTDLAYHRYRGVSMKTLEDIGSQAAAHGIRTAMLEHIGAGREALFDDLTTGQVSRWQQYVLGWPDLSDDGSVYAIATRDASGRLRVTPARTTLELSRYFRAIRRGAVRISAESSHAGVHPIAFENSDGTTVAVIAIEGRAGLTVTGLPAGGLQADFLSTEDQSRGVQLLRGDAPGSLFVELPSAGILTIRVLRPLS